MFEISIEDSFDAAHCLPDYEGNCSRLHGHTYKVQVVFKFRQLNPNGLAIDFKTAKTSVKNILAKFDHRYLNEMPQFSEKPPTAENIAFMLYKEIKVVIPELFSVSVWETSTNCAKYYED